MEEGSIAYRPVAKWDTDEVVSWMRGLHKSLEDHIPQFLAHCICGNDLLKMSHQQLEYLKVTQIGHQELLLEAVEMLSALEKGRSQDFTLSLASTLSKKTSQLIHAINAPPSRKKQAELSPEQSSLQLRESTSGVMVAAKLLLNWLDRNPCSLVDDYDNFRTEVLKSALNLANMTKKDYDAQQMKDSCRAILKFTGVMMSPQSLSCMEPIKLLTVQLQPRDDSGLGFSIQRTRQGNLVVGHVVPESPAYDSGVIMPGVEIVQINHQSVVGWEMNEVIETLKASGHQVTLIVNTGNAKTLQRTTPDHDGGEEGEEEEEEMGTGSTLQHPGEERRVARCERSEEDAAKSISQSQEESSDDLPSSSTRNDPTTSLSTNYSDDKSSSQDTLDDIAESPESLEGDTDFSGMENVLNRTRMPLDLHRTSSAPLSVCRDGRGTLLEMSTDSSSTTGTHDGDLSLGSEVTGSLEALHMQSGKGVGSFESRLTSRTGSDNTVGASKGSAAKKAKKPQSNLPQVAYRTQVIGGVVVRIPIKQEDQEKPKEKKVRHQRQRSRHKKNHGSGVTVRAGEGPGSGDAAAGGVGEAQAAADENGSAGGGGSPEKGKAVFSDLKEVTIGGQTTKQITVSSSTEIVGGKKSSNPALMVPCFQLKDADREGFMYKLGGSGFTPKNWRRRWFVLKDRKLFYYKTSFDIAALGIVNMTGYTMEQSSKSKIKHAFKAIKEGQRTYYFYTDSHDEMMSWMEDLAKSSEGDQDLTDGQATIEASDDEL